jgi:peptide/nickel transport system permease protein
MKSPARIAGLLMLVLVAGAALFAPVFTPHSGIEQFVDHAYAPPMWPRIVDAEGRLRAPFVYPLTLADRLERRFVEDTSRPLPLRWFLRGAIVSVDEPDEPWLPLGGDALGRDVFARLIRGGRVSLAVAALASAGALCLGALVGAAAGFHGGRLDTALMAIADLVLILPAIYVVLTLRAAMPLVLTPAQIFWTMAGVLAAAGWPLAARGVRAIVATERSREYAEAARAAGAGPLRILLRHLLPAAAGFLAVHAALLLPAFVLAEATLSFVGLGFAEPTASWGIMLGDAGRGRAFAEAPWLLSPAVAIALTSMAVTLLTSGAAHSERIP